VTFTVFEEADTFLAAALLIADTDPFVAILFGVVFYWLAFLCRCFLVVAFFCAIFPVCCFIYCSFFGRRNFFSL
jgi:hypothetical protein